MYAPAKRSKLAYLASETPITIQKYVTGEVRIKLCKGGIFVDGLRSAYSLYDYNLATYDEGDTFDHSASRGFIELHSLPSRTWSRIQGPGSGLAPIH